MHCTRIILFTLMILTLLQSTYSQSPNPKIPKYDFKLSDVQFSPKIESFSYNESGWIAITGETVTGSTWKSASIVIVATTYRYGEKMNTYRLLLTLPPDSRKRFFLYVFMFRGVTTKTTVSAFLKQEVLDEMTLSVNTDGHGNLQIAYLGEEKPKELSCLYEIKLYSIFRHAKPTTGSSQEETEDSVAATDKKTVYYYSTANVPRARSYQNKEDGVKEENAVYSLSYSDVNYSGTYYEGERSFSKIQPMNLPPSLTPDRWIGYQLLDTMLMDKDISINTEKTRAIIQWLEAGGLLLLTPKDVSWLRHSTFVQEILKMKIDDKNHVSITPPALWSKYIPNISGAYSLKGPPNAIVAKGSKNTFWFCPHGQGAVLYVGIDTGTDIASSLALWQRVILPQIFRHYYRTDKPGRDYGYDEYGYHSGMSLESLNLSSKRSPGSWSILICLLFYLVVIGPVNFIFLRYKKKTILLVCTIPMISLLFAFIFIGYGFCSRGLYAETSALHLIFETPDSDYGYHQKYFSLFSGSHNLYTIGVDKDSCMQPIIKGYGRTQKAFYEQSSGIALVEYPLSFWQTGFFSTEAMFPKTGVNIYYQNGKVEIKKPPELEFKSIVWIEEKKCYLLEKMDKGTEEKTFDLAKLPKVSIDLPSSRYGYRENYGRFFAGELKKLWQIEDEKMAMLETMIGMTYVASCKRKQALIHLEDASGALLPSYIDPQPRVVKEWKVLYFVMQ